MSREKEEKIELIGRLIFWIITAAYGVACFYLYYNQSIQPLDYDNRYFQSDLPYHISMVVDDGWYYSLTALIYILLYKLASGGTVLIAAFLALVSIVTVLITEKILKTIGFDHIAVSAGGAILLNLVMPAYVKWAGVYRYVSYQAGNVWHNSTYQCMKLGALVCMLIYIGLDKKLRDEGLSIKELVIFAVALAITTFIKPSFLTVFAPAFALSLLYDFISKKIKFVRALLFGITVLPACVVMIWQNSILFGEETENGFKFSFMETFMLHADRPKITVLLSLAFPIVVFVMLFIMWIISKIKKSQNVISILSDRQYLFSATMSVIGFAEAALLVETGSRSRDGNFLWGYSFGLFWLYLISFKKLYEMVQKKKWAYAIIAFLVLAYQFICGAVFFVRLMHGETYFMQR